MSYDPLYHPFELPIQQLRLHCRLAEPLHLEPRPGSTPGTSLAGVFGHALWDTQCRRLQRGDHACHREPSTLDPSGRSAACCHEPEHCPVRWLHGGKQLNNLPRPLLLHAPELEENRPVDTFTLHLTLWGRQALALAEPILQSLAAAGERGIIGPDEYPIPFAVEALEEGPVLSLAERLAPLQQVAWRGALLRFVTLFRHKETVTLMEGGRSVSRKLYFARGELPLAKMLGNVAYQLAAWDMQDRELDGVDRHDLARQARRAAEAAAEWVGVVRSDLLPVDHGERLAKSNGRLYSLHGFVGEVELAGELDEALPRLREQAASAPDLPTLIGIEGAASAGYFQSWRQLWQAPWTFPGRNRRPPRDPVNALLSLSYTMALGYLGRLLSLHGLDPAIGFLHGPQRGRPALALDLLEILRPGLDHWVWTLLASSGELQPTDFNDSDSEGCRLSRDGRENYYTAWFRDEESRLRIPAREGLAGLLRGLRGGRPRDWGVNGGIDRH